MHAVEEVSRSQINSQAAQQHQNEAGNAAVEEAASAFGRGRGNWWSRAWGLYGICSGLGLPLRGQGWHGEWWVRQGSGCVWGDLVGVDFVGIEWLGDLGIVGDDKIVCPTGGIRGGLEGVKQGPAKQSHSRYWRLRSGSLEVSVTP